MENVEEVKKKCKRKESRYGKRYGLEFKLRCVKLRLEEGIPVALLSKEVGASKDVIRRWAKAYQERGEAGLRNRIVSKESRRKLPGPVREKIVEIKKREPLFGVKRISHLLKRTFFLSASPETVRRTLRKELLIVPSKKKHQRNVTHPRFFERSTPNQLWQGDIFTFRLGGRYAYLIGFIDDYSRYVVGLELYRSQTADQVIEVYRRAVGEYGVPKEVLTDRGRQYTNWRGTTRFERELGKDRVKHIKSQAHHPMTLGKIERFWKTIYEEFLVRSQFGSFEEAQERCHAVLTLWTERRKPGEICREMGVTWGVLQQWQDRAMEGMLMALQPRVQVERGVALSPRLAVLLKRSQAGMMKRLDKRLRKVQGNRKVPPEEREAAVEKKI